VTRDQMLYDLYERLTSRKFWGFLLTIGFALWNFEAGRMDAVQFQTAITAAFTVYGVVEGASDFAAALRPKRSPDAVVNVDASPAPAATTSHQRPPRATGGSGRAEPGRRSR
jgi:hypothetical protein